MSADLYLCAIADTASHRSLLSKMRAVNTSETAFIEYTDEWSRMLDAVYERVKDRVHVGEVSFAKAMIANDPYWIPAPVRAVLFYFGGEFTPKVANRASSADVTSRMSAPDQSHYRTWHRRNRRTSRRRAVKRFFANNDGALSVCAALHPYTGRMGNAVVINHNYAHVITKLLRIHGLRGDVLGSPTEVTVTCANGLEARAVMEVLQRRGYRFSTSTPPQGTQFRIHITRRLRA